MEVEPAMLIEPDVSWRDEFIAYCEEFKAADEPYAHGQLPDAQKDFPGLIRRWAQGAAGNKSEGITVPADDVPNLIYWLVRGRRILGTVRLRLTINESLLQIGGHIGYEVRASERRKGYATILLRTALEKARERGLERVLLTCARDNVASARTICRHGGILENEVVSRRSGKVVQRYGITLRPSGVSSVGSSPMLSIREMQVGDIGRCIWVRTQTRENRWSLEALRKGGVTEESVATRLQVSHKGWVCEEEGQEGQIVGFSMGDRSNGELWVVAVLPEYEGRGIGRRLVEAAQDWLHACGWEEIWLWTSPNTATRAYRLYRRLGWQDCGVKDGQLIMRRRAGQSANRRPEAG
jgi:predicted acetyltransferase